jgi:lactam utilization protein B
MERIKYTNAPQATAREIVAERCNVLESTLDLIESMDCHGHTVWWDMVDLISFAHREDIKSRAQLAADRRYAATKRLVKMLSKSLASAINDDELDDAERIADAIKYYTYSLGNI